MIAQQAEVQAVVPAIANGLVRIRMRAVTSVVKRATFNFAYRLGCFMFD
jgi:hypothetical protein